MSTYKKGEGVLVLGVPKELPVHYEGKASLFKNEFAPETRVIILSFLNENIMYISSLEWGSSV